MLGMSDIVENLTNYMSVNLQNNESLNRSELVSEYWRIIY